eukprot:GHVO01070364.1.p2 GENE.GHVO01070364.1~~GHVO01070364.1.p2  ORF type:complete len:117 (+),score=1.42 GHVO01070364.1:848-1198(+)
MRAIVSSTNAANNLRFVVAEMGFGESNIDVDIESKIRKEWNTYLANDRSCHVQLSFEILNVLNGDQMCEGFTHYHFHYFLRFHLNLFFSFFLSLCLCSFSFFIFYVHVCREKMMYY